MKEYGLRPGHASRGFQSPGLPNDNDGHAYITKVAWVQDTYTQNTLVLLLKKSEDDERWLIFYF